jgi:hypothetical protein
MHMARWFTRLRSAGRCALVLVLALSMCCATTNGEQLAQAGGALPEGMDEEVRQLQQLFPGL